MARKGSFANQITTPQELYDLFILCLWWQADFTSLSTMWTTVDKVLTILENLKIVNEVTRKNVKLRDDVKRAFRRSMFICPLGFYGSKPKAAAEGIAKQPERLVLYGYDLQRVKDRLLFDTRIHLSNSGREYAAKIEPEYSDILTRDQYTRENERRNQEFAEIPEEVRAGMRSRYANKVDREVVGKKNADRKSHRARMIARVSEDNALAVEEEEGHI